MLHRQKSFMNDQPTVYLVPTPIGNLLEMTSRAIEILKMVDVIACEDTRTSSKLLNYYGICTRCVAHHNYNEQASSMGLLNLLKEGLNVAIISDAGYPLISDPGQYIVLKALEMGYNVVPVSGASASLNALVASGLIAQPFSFIGFISAHRNEALRQLQQYQTLPMTMIFYESPHRIKKTLTLMLEVFANRQICLCRELTKKHEEFLRGTILEVLEVVDELKGEMVIVVEGFHQQEQALDLDNVINLVNGLMAQGLSKSAAIKEVAKTTGISKNEIYNQVHAKA